MSEGRHTEGGDTRAGLATAGQWQLAWIKFRQNRVALVAGVVLALMYAMTLFGGFLAPYEPDHRFGRRAYVPPQGLHLFSPDGFEGRPFVYGLTTHPEASSGRTLYTHDVDKRYPLRLFHRGDPHSFLGIETDLHLFGIDAEGQDGMFLFGTDRQGRDLLSRILYGARISLTIGLLGVTISVVLGAVLGVTSGYFGGWVDELMQRTVEMLRAFPQIPLWMALSAAIPPDIDQITSYFMITLILSLLGWTSLARIVRGKVLSLRAEEFVMAAQLMGASHKRVIFRHLIPGVMGEIIVVATIAVPSMILAESALSFLNLGIRPPMTSWGVLLQDGRQLTTLYFHQWLLLPAAFIVVVVLCFNFLGDAFRDAADPYTE